MALSHALRANDRLAVSKLVTQLMRCNVRSPAAQCLLVRYVSQVIADSGPGQAGEPRPFYDFLESCLRHKSGAQQLQLQRLAAALRGARLAWRGPAPPCWSNRARCPTACRSPAPSPTVCRDGDL